MLKVEALSEKLIQSRHLILLGLDRPL
jgi:hypothetical protein